MIPLLLMLAAADAPAMMPVDAERAFAADAQKIGQWTAFRKWSTDDATMFVPQSANAHEFLKDRKDPPEAIDWWPTASYISCDGKLAVNTGGWKTADGSVGYFSTVWQRQPDGGWKWIVDGGDDLKVARPKPKDVGIKRASCDGGAFASRLDDERVKPQATGNADDGSSYWHWVTRPDGSRHFIAGIWNGKGFDKVIDDKIAPAK